MSFREESSGSCGTSVGANIHLVCGRQPILQMQSMLMDFGERCNQAGAMADIGYFLSKPGILPKDPCLLLVTRFPVRDAQTIQADDLEAAVLLHRYKVFGCSLKIFSTNDRSGYETLVAPPAMRSRMAGLVSRCLLNNGAVAVMICFREDDSQERPSGIAESLLTGACLRWARRDHMIMDHLPLAATYDETLAHVGKRTRRNLRYYRKQAEADLGCVFVPQVEITKDEFLAVNRESMYAVSDKAAAWRYDSLHDVAEPLLVGIKDRDGRWLSLLGARRHRDGSRILWQVNRNGFENYSLGVVMRSYFIEHEVAQGSQRLYMEGGTGHSIGHSFLKAQVSELAVIRRSLVGRLLPLIAKPFVSQDNDLASMLVRHDIVWHSPENYVPEVSRKGVTI